LPLQFLLKIADRKIPDHPWPNKIKTKLNEEKIDEKYLS
jgi:hypothetical protein